ncbi:cytochrome P450 [Conidiobolus coronatus NRRL 28638]|uniref:Cytochrome P450 n=1 Tax=Conidiobolus coronatus (strain ATCC 28846 / CBS 209.66 / NRRL 28638) TaxID=796925 RepID=A0A137P047_CONC2|nr:cytochrome P450 [Conidiobolus coronatus NRRL 28638]|eukprot:KXN68425.1 cytochrome P450 [Conidiobolus coronatus NRRL 28638]
MLKYLGTTLIAYISYKVYNWTSCPEEIKHLPALRYWAFFHFVFSKDSFDDKCRKDFQPMFDKYGVVRAFTPFGWGVFIGDPKLCKEAAALVDVFPKQDLKNAPISGLLMKYFGRSQVISNNGDEWKRHRKVINPIFNQTWNTELFGDCAKDVISEWEKHVGDEIKVRDIIQKMTLDVFGRAIFDVNFNAVKGNESRLYVLYNSIIGQAFGQVLYLFAPFMEHVPFFRRPKLSKEIDEYYELIEEMIAEKKRQIQEGSTRSKDLITAFIESNEKEGEFKLTTDEIKHNINAFISAGHDTTSNTLTTALYYLARYPETQEKLRAEILEALDNPTELVTPTIDQLKRIPYLDMTIKESMRILTTAANVQRDTVKTHTLSNGLTIPKGTQIFFHLWGIHNNASAFPNPEKFNPERFSDIHNQESRNWQPFMTGPRSCIGMTLSLMEQRVTIAMLLQKFEFIIQKENPNYEKLFITPMGLVHPKDLTLTVKLRD